MNQLDRESLKEEEMTTKVKTIRICVAIISCLCAAATFSCKKEASDTRPVIAVSINPQRFLLEKIAGDDFAIETVLPHGENPETFDPSMSVRKAVEDADIYFTTGYLAFEGNLLFNNNNTTKFVDTSEGIEPVYGTHDHVTGNKLFLTGEGQKRASADPHIWTSVKNAKVMVKNMTRALAELNPEGAAEYQRRSDLYIAHLDSLDDAIASELDTITGRSFIVWHPSLSYFARDYGLEQIAVGHETKEPSAGGLKQVVDYARKDSVKVFFYQESLDSRTAEALGAGIGATMHIIDPLAYDWESTIATVVDALHSN